MKKTVCLLLSIVFLFLFSSCDKNKNTDNTDKTVVANSGDFSSFSKSGKDFCKNLKVGWNLGNTLDACHIWGDISDEPTPNEQETGWNNPQTTQKIIDKVAESGFNAIRVPITWDLQIVEKDGKYIIKEEFLKRVKEVVDYCINDSLYTIINVHHDDQYWLNISVSDDEFKQVKEKYRQIWKQIAEYFKDYDNRLIFEAANEITANTSFDECGDSETDKCWWGHNDKVFERINGLYEIFQKEVRLSGDNNSKRYLMLPTYGAQWYDNQIYKLKMPSDDDHIIIDVHWYQPDSYDGENNRWVFEMMKDFSDSHSVGAVLGETGLMKSCDDEQKKAFGENVVAIAKEYDVPVFLWDDGGDLQILDRNKLEWNSKVFVDSVIKNAK